jgi:hypothetical protein
MQNPDSTGAATHSRLIFHSSLSSHQRRRELIAFARYCTNRIERGIRGIESWDVSIKDAGKEFTALVQVHFRDTRGSSLHASSSSADPDGRDVAGAL